MPPGTLAQHYLSFTRDGEFLGAIVIPARTHADAVTVARLTGLAPDGAVTGVQFPLDTFAHEWTFRLLTAAEAKGLPKPAWLLDVEAGADPPQLRWSLPVRHDDDDASETDPA